MPAQTMIPFKEAMKIVGHLLPNRCNTQLAHYGIKTEYKPYYTKKHGTKLRAMYCKRDVIRVKEWLMEKKKANY